MNKPRMVYFEQEDIVHLTISEGPESRSVEISPNVTKVGESRSASLAVCRQHKELAEITDSDKEARVQKCVCCPRMRPEYVIFQFEY